MLRSNLVILSYQLFENEITLDLIKAASIMEFIHSSLLIHDDIIDRDIFRRTGKSIFYQYHEDGEKKNYRDSYHYGQVMGLCVGNIALLLALDILLTMEIPPAMKGEIQKLVTDELLMLGLAEMEEIDLTFSSKKMSEKNILKLYLYKTARYTFSVPLILGGMLAKKKPPTIRLLEKIGENMGIIYQIKDDEIELFGNKEGNKFYLSDIREGKKTLFFYYLLKKANKIEKDKLNWIFQKSKIEKKSIDFILSLLQRYKIRDNIQLKINEFYNKTLDLINQIEIPTDKKTPLYTILEYNLNRVY